MSEVKEFTNKINENFITTNGVQALSNRPNSSSQYGKGGLSAADLKAWFDNLGTKLIKCVTELQDELNSSNAPAYIGVSLNEKDITLGDFISSFKTGEIAKILKLYPSLSETEETDLSTLQDVIDTIASEIATINENKLDKNTEESENERVYAIDKKGTQTQKSISESPKNGTIPIYGEQGQLKVGYSKANDDATSVKFVNDTVGSLESSINSLSETIEAVSKEQQNFESKEKSAFSNALKETKVGEILTISDGSPVEHTMSIKVNSKNLIPFPFYEGTKQANGLTVTDNNDGSISFSGTTTNTFTYYFTSNNNSFSLPAGTYTISASGDWSSTDTLTIWVNNTSTDQIISYLNLEKRQATFTLKQEESFSIYLYTYEGRTVSGTLKLQLEVGATATDFEPWIDVSTVKLIKTGLNIWDEKWALGTVYSSGNIGSSDNTIRSKNYIPVKAGVKYGVYAPQMSRFLLYDTNKKFYLCFYPSKNGSFTPDIDGYIMFAIGGSISGTEMITEYSYNICISIYDEAAVGIYEPYKGEEYQIDSGGPVERVTSAYPTTTLFTDKAGTIVTAEYNRDLNKAFAELYNAIISLGGNV